MFNKKNTQKSDPDRIQTYNLLIRSQMLYSVELPSHQADLPTSLVTAKVQYLDKFSKDSRPGSEGVDSRTKCNREEERGEKFERRDVVMFLPGSVVE